MDQSNGNIYTKEQQEQWKDFLDRISNEGKISIGKLFQMDKMPDINCPICMGSGRIRVKRGQLRGLYQPCQCTKAAEKSND